MVQPLEQKKRQKIFLIILVVVVVITVVVWYLNYQKKPLSEELISLGGLPGSSITEEKLKVIKLDFGILDNNLFKSLKPHGDLPVTSGETGRENPFEPY